MHTVRTGPVDDDSEHLKLIREFLGRHKRERKVGFSIEEYRDGLNFAEDYNRTLGVVFLDIEMPHIDGTTMVKEIREGDQTPGIMFATDMAQFAVRDYEISTIDFTVKPVSYYVFTDKLKKAIQFPCAKTEKELVVQIEESIVKPTGSQLLYIEKDKNYLARHALRGESRIRETLITLEESLKGESLSKCISGCLISLRYVTKIPKDMVWAEQASLPVSRHRSREFREGFMRYLGGDY